MKREGVMQGMAMELNKKLSAGVGVYLWLVLMGKKIPNIVQNNTLKKGEDYAEGGRLWRLPLHLVMQAFHG